MPKARVTRSAARLEEQDPPPPEEALRDWLKIREALSVSFSQLWRLPWEKEVLVAADFNGMLQRALSRRGLSAPVGFIYTGHSTRAGALSEGNARGIPISTLRYMGGFAVGSPVPEHPIQVTCFSASHMF